MTHMKAGRAKIIVALVNTDRIMQEIEEIWNP
ncbi:MAG: hypothetical protein BWX81_02136 [Spirochaetes bacterium ADurb.Bin110]|jgi:hypothetical protein|nr:MAG: hypothetical protein BWX81_02136 [Spirochaetes bacterium ADurb.Bin110]